jgi:hypothetical protein
MATAHRRARWVVRIAVPMATRIVGAIAARSPRDRRALERGQARARSVMPSVVLTDAGRSTRHARRHRDCQVDTPRSRTAEPPHAG